MKQFLNSLKVIIPPFEKICVGTTLLADPTRTLALEYYEFVCQGVRFTDFFFKESTFSKHVTEGSPFTNRDQPVKMQTFDFPYIFACNTSQMQFPCNIRLSLAYNHDKQILSGFL